MGFFRVIVRAALAVTLLAVLAGVGALAAGTLRQGQVLTFVLYRHADYQRAYTRGALVLLDTSTRLTYALTGHTTDESTPAWSPDGLRLAFTSDQDARQVGRVRALETQLYVMDAQGGQPQPVFTQADFGRTLLPVWSPDGAQLAFLTTIGGRGFDIELGVIPVEQPAALRLLGPHHAEFAPPAWSPDSTRIAFTGDSAARMGDVFVVDVMTGESRALVPDGGLACSSLRNPAWSPDGTQIAFLCPVGETAGVYVANADGSDLKRVADYTLSRSVNQQEAPVWSPDGSRLIFSSRTQADRHDLIQVTLASGEVTNITARYTPIGTESHAPLWLGDTLVFIVDIHNSPVRHSSLYALTDGTLRRLTYWDDVYLRDLTWRP